MGLCGGLHVGIYFMRSSAWKGLTPGTGVTGDWVVSHRNWKWETKLGPSAKVVLLITADPSFQSCRNTHDVKQPQKYYQTVR